MDAIVVVPKNSYNNKPIPIKKNENVIPEEGAVEAYLIDNYLFNQFKHLPIETQVEQRKKYLKTINIIKTTTTNPKTLGIVIELKWRMEDRINRLLEKIVPNNKTSRANLEDFLDYARRTEN
jgi:hypothetical protein